MNEKELKKLGFNTIQYDIDLKLTFCKSKFNFSFNTIQYDIDLKRFIWCLSYF